MNGALYVEVDAGLESVDEQEVRNEIGEIVEALLKELIVLIDAFAVLI